MVRIGCNRKTPASSLVLSLVLIIAGTALSPHAVVASGPPPAEAAAMKARLSTGLPLDLIILFDDRDIETEASASKSSRGLSHDDASVLSRKKDRYRELKRSVIPDLTAVDGETVQDYDHLPMSRISIRSPRAFSRLISDTRIQAVYENQPVYRQLVQSLPLIRNPEMIALGYQGNGTTVAVIDTGIDFAADAFGSCTAPGVPGTCRVAVSIDASGTTPVIVTTENDSIGHGTNVAGTVAGTAPASRIAAVKVFSDSGTASDATVIQGINWAIANRETYNIVALNLSLGNGLKYTAPCGSKTTNPYVTPINNARAAGIIPVAAAGNDRYVDGLSRPACTPGAVSVGAVYDGNVGGLIWGTAPNTCTDSTTTADKIPCFSNSASFLTMLAPGAMITAAGSTLGGTSQATPHVAGAIAILRAAYPGDTLDGTVARLVTGGTPVTDTRNGLVKPRLDMQGALGVEADLAASVTIAPTMPETGSVFDYTVQVSNSGPSPAAASLLGITLPSGVTAVSLPVSCTSGAGTVTCDLGTIATGSYPITLIGMRIDLPGQFTIRATVSSATPDPQLNNNTAITDVTSSQAAAVPGISTLLLGIAVLIVIPMLPSIENSRPSRKELP